MKGLLCQALNVTTKISYNPHSANLGLTPNQKEENYFNSIN
ncbi:hypothetical protein [Lactococcus garvieae]|uniref:Uncharacterized protein n=1 Tax=Lactococcus garvieae TaxID=1363 RepID=A0AA46YQ93_9LACT|nr:hypothetical protein [Lactococcus garvieae]UYT09585.1 hypothetical protein OF801_06250 [Lactococcus garvieae]